MDEHNSSSADGWVYFFGEVAGNDIKVGWHGGLNLADRLEQVNREQTTNESYVILAGVRGTKKDEDATLRYFKDHLRPKGRRTEYFSPSPAVVEYVNWLRQRWWTAMDATELRTALPLEDPDHWLPRDERRAPRPTDDPEALIQRYVQLDGPLAGTAWAWMPSPKPSIQDYFTPPELLDAAREAMGGVDLDPASHWIANRRHRVPTYYALNEGRDAFDLDWFGRVWLNPPYGNNAPWFEKIVSCFDDGQIEQICVLSPVWAFTTKVAREFMERATALVLLTPTPKFWGNSEGREGTNNPHGIVYLGDRRDEFLQAFREVPVTYDNGQDAVLHGLPCWLDHARLAAT